MQFYNAKTLKLKGQYDNIVYLSKAVQLHYIRNYISCILSNNIWLLRIYIVSSSHHPFNSKFYLENNYTATKISTHEKQIDVLPSKKPALLINCYSMYCNNNYDIMSKSHEQRLITKEHIAINSFLKPACT